jgi:hypothetical protein
MMFFTTMVPLVQKLTHLEKHLVLSHFAFVLIYKIYGYGQYKMHGNVINVLANVNQTQSILSYIPYDKATIGMFLK